ncbi:MAG TPA: 3-deoxy-D-manno-octulosonic acid transferase, partial [Alphaproteobacteria bacterium]|nr:3-deoxy-D-manno-octulosonic acid transferase [Alphaproteobacteria bacterium]
ISRGKDRPERLPERFGKANISRPDGTLIWVHAASVGESVSALSLARLLFEKQPDIVILITSGTVTSA